MSGQPGSTRREFLTGKAATDALADRLPETTGPGADAPPPTPPPDRYLIQVSRPAMACRFEIWFGADQYPDGTGWATAALDLVEQLEEQMSIFRPASELCSINRQAAHGAVVVEPRLFELIEKGQAIYQETDGAFDMTTGPLSRAWGFLPGPPDRRPRSPTVSQPAGARGTGVKRLRRVPAAAALAHARTRVGGRHVELDPATHAIHFRTPQIELDLGGIGKGHALDRCAELLHEAGMHDFLIHGGQSSVLAAGAHPATPGQGWRIGLRHPLRPNARLAEFLLRDRALGTSGSGTQFFHHHGKRYGHLIDPRTGRPAEGVYSTTVLAPEAATADALATAFYVLGPQGTGEYCARHPEISAMLAVPGTKQGTVQLETFGLETGVVDSSA